VLGGIELGQEELIILGRLTVALGVGALIGLERSFRGRPAGFRTHALVCLASALLMLVTVYQDRWMTHVPFEAVRTDPTRMAQGIMTGIGFLGAGVIFKEGLTVRGLTTSASIWVTAAIGILVGVGFYYPAGVGTALTLAALAGFNYIERRLPTESYAQLNISFARDDAMSAEEVRGLAAEHRFNSSSGVSYRLDDDGRRVEYRMTIRSYDRRQFDRLSERLRGLPQVLAFKITPTGD
jgi:putative Mg2+ transporter-C (MgtC) family protein